MLHNLLLLCRYVGGGGASPYNGSHHAERSMPYNAPQVLRDLLSVFLVGFVGFLTAVGE